VQIAFAREPNHSGEARDASSESTVHSRKLFANQPRTLAARERHDIRATLKIG
jgi:hypothetical protein